VYLLVAAVCAKENVNRKEILHITPTKASKVKMCGEMQNIKEG